MKKKFFAMLIAATVVIANAVGGSTPTINAEGIENAVPAEENVMSNMEEEESYLEENIDAGYKESTADLDINETNAWLADNTLTDETDPYVLTEDSEGTSAMLQAASALAAKFEARSMFVRFEIWQFGSNPVEEEPVGLFWGNSDFSEIDLSESGDVCHFVTGSDIPNWGNDDSLESVNLTFENSTKTITGNVTITGFDRITSNSTEITLNIESSEFDFGNNNTITVPVQIDKEKTQLINISEGSTYTTNVGYDAQANTEFNTFAYFTPSTSGEYILSGTGGKSIAVNILDVNKSSNKLVGQIIEGTTTKSVKLQLTGGREYRIFFWYEGTSGESNSMESVTFSISKSVSQDSTTGNTSATTNNSSTQTTKSSSSASSKSSSKKSSTKKNTKKASAKKSSKITSKKKSSAKKSSSKKTSSNKKTGKKKSTKKKSSNKK